MKRRLRNWKREVIYRRVFPVKKDPFPAFRVGVLIMEEFEYSRKHFRFFCFLVNYFDVRGVNFPGS